MKFNNTNKDLSKFNNNDNLENVISSVNSSGNKEKEIIGGQNKGVSGKEKQLNIISNSNNSSSHQTMNNLNVNLNLNKISTIKEGKENIKANNNNNLNNIQTKVNQSGNNLNLQINTTSINSLTQDKKGIPSSTKNETAKPKMFQNLQVNLKTNSPKTSMKKGGENKK